MAFGTLFVEGLRLMRERAIVYAVLAAACALVEWSAYARVDLVAGLQGAAAGHPLQLFLEPPLGTVLGLSLLAQFFIIPGAVKRIEPSFRLTVAAVVIMIVTIALVGFVTDLGYALAIVPGLLIAVLLSQALVGALVRSRAGMSLGEGFGTIGASLRGSYAMTRGHFATTAAVLVVSLAILIVPFCLAAFWVIVFGVEQPPWLVATAPALLLLFVYLECVRYSLIVRWYRRLASAAEDAESQPA